MGLDSSFAASFNDQARITLSPVALVDFILSSV